MYKIYVSWMPTEKYHLKVKRYSEFAQWYETIKKNNPFMTFWYEISTKTNEIYVYAK